MRHSTTFKYLFEISLGRSLDRLIGNSQVYSTFVKQSEVLQTRCNQTHYTSKARWTCVLMNSSSGNGRPGMWNERLHA